MARLRTLLLSLLLGVVAPCGAGAQWRASLELSGARLQLDAQPSAGALSLGGAVARDDARTSFDLSALATLGADARRTTQAFAAATLFGAHGRAARWSLGADGGAYTERGTDASLSGYLVARERFVFRRSGAWAGLAVGGVRDRGDDFGVRMGDAGLWHAVGRLRAAATATLVDTRAVSVVQGVWVTEPATYSDAGADLRWSSRDAGVAGALALRATLGARLISRGADGATRKGFGGADVELAVRPRVMLTAAAGRQLSDLARGTPASRYVALGLRVALRDEAPAARSHTTRAPNAPRVLIERGAGGEALLVVIAPAASVIEITGTLTDWEPVALESRGGRFVLAHAVASGTHRLLVRADGGPWTPPANLPAAADEDGARTALLVVP